MNLSCECPFRATVTLFTHLFMAATTHVGGAPSTEFFNLTPAGRFNGPSTGFSEFHGSSTSSTELNGLHPAATRMTPVWRQGPESGVAVPLMLEWYSDADTYTDVFTAHV